MDTTKLPVARLDRHDLQTYWRDLSTRHLDDSHDGLEVICYAGMPDWFNRFIHSFQMKSFKRLVGDQSFSDCDVLDIGTGVGRWARWYTQWPGSRVVGIDIEAARLARATALGGGPVYRNMSVDALALDDASFDVVNSVTVLQHVPDAMKRAAIREIARVLRPNGRVVLFEVTDTSDDAPHVFPWTRETWDQEFGKYGFVVVRTVGNEYIPLLRLLKRAHRGVAGDRSRSEIDALKTGRSTRSDKVKLALLRGAVLASYPLEDACRIVPSGAARITGFLLQRSGDRVKSLRDERVLAVQHDETRHPQY
jgi:SAM-dependent methyltransferase